MRRIIFTALFIISFWGSSCQSSCLIDLLELSSKNVDKIKNDVDRTLSKISSLIKKTDANVKSYIASSKDANDKERQNLVTIETAAYGEALAKKRSIADCFEHDRVQMKMINSTEAVIYALCEDNLSIMLVQASLIPLKRIPKEASNVLPKCLETFPTSCQDQRKCLLDEFNAYEKKVDEKRTKVQTKLSKIQDTSKICSDGKQNVIISLIKELEESFQYCSNQIIG